MGCRLDETVLVPVTLVCGLFFGVFGHASGDVVTLPAEMDAHVILGEPDANRGDAEKLLVADPHQSDIARAFVQFSLDPIPQGATINSAKFRLFNDWTLDECAEIGAYRVLAAWEESSITWANQPDFAPHDDYEDIVNLGDEGALDWVTWDVSELVAGWVDGSLDNHGLVVKVPIERANWYCARTFLSRESHETELRPQLVVYYNLEGYEHPVVADSYVDQSMPDSNFGGSKQLLVVNTSWEVLRTYVQFDLSGIPPGADIRHAELVLENFNWWDDCCPKIDLHRVMGVWEEYGITWNNQPDFEPEPRCGIFLRDDFFPTGFYAWEITGLVQGWVDELYPNYGLVLRPRNEGEDTFRVARGFFSREAGGDYQRAGIYVFYEATPGADELKEGTPTSTFMLFSHPNPSQSTIELKFYLPAPAHTALKVYDGSGRLVRTLVNRGMGAGTHRLCWDGKDSRGHRLATGIYVFHLTSGPFHHSQKALLTR